MLCSGLTSKMISGSPLVAAKSLNVSGDEEPQDPDEQVDDAEDGADQPVGRVLKPASRAARG